jgi:hypothetical protein
MGSSRGSPGLGESAAEERRTDHLIPQTSVSEKKLVWQSSRLAPLVVLFGAVIAASSPSQIPRSPLTCEQA